MSAPNGAPNGGGDYPWAIIPDGLRSYVGKLVAVADGLQTLSPVYELRRELQIRPSRVTRGAVECGIQCACLPVLALGSLTRLDITTAVRPILLDDLDRRERAEIMGAVNECEALIRSMRAEGAGILLAPGGREAVRP